MTDEDYQNYTNALWEEVEHSRQNEKKNKRNKKQIKKHNVNHKIGIYNRTIGILICLAIVLLGYELAADTLLLNFPTLIQIKAIALLAMAMIPATIAARKGYSYWIFYISGILAWIVALICSLIFTDYNNNNS